MRVDLLLVNKKLVSTRTRAQEMIKNQQIFIVNNGVSRLVTKSSEDFPIDSVFYIEDGFASDFVSRAGHKIKGAAELLGLDFKNKQCLDVGVSSGGFSDFLLKAGAASVLGIDVGQGQTHQAIRNHSQFKLLEKTNARYLDENKQFQDLVPKLGFDFICMDVSFISSLLILPKLKPWLGKNGQLLALVKPQFELGPAALNEKGIVKDSSQYLELERVMVDAANAMSFKVEKYFSSSIQGKDGNHEFFLYLTI